MIFELYKKGEYEKFISKKALQYVYQRSIKKWKRDYMNNLYFEELVESIKNIENVMTLKYKENRFITIKEFSKTSGLAEYEVRRLVNEGKLITHIAGNKIYIHFGKSMELLVKEAKNRML